MIFYGGNVNPGPMTSDVWVWELKGGGNGCWKKLNPTGGPPPNRMICSNLYDPINDRMIVFGGSQPGPVYLQDTWELSFSTNPQGIWSQLTPGTPPSIRAGTPAVYDSKRHRMLIFGGLDAPANTL